MTFDGFDGHQNTGWLTIRSRDRRLRSQFGTDRLGKRMPNGELLITIGATQVGMSFRLNETIANYIRSSGLTVLDRSTSAGNRQARYPGFDTGLVSHAAVLRILRNVESEAKRLAATKLER